MNKKVKNKKQKKLEGFLNHGINEDYMITMMKNLYGLRGETVKFEKRIDSIDIHFNYHSGIIFLDIRQIVQDKDKVYQITFHNDMIKVHLFLNFDKKNCIHKGRIIVMDKRIRNGLADLNCDITDNNCDIGTLFGTLMTDRKCQSDKFLFEDVEYLFYSLVRRYDEVGLMGQTFTIVVDDISPECSEKHTELSLNCKNLITIKDRINLESKELTKAFDKLYDKNFYDHLNYVFNSNTVFIVNNERFKAHINFTQSELSNRDYEVSLILNDDLNSYIIYNEFNIDDNFNTVLKVIEAELVNTFFKRTDEGFIASIIYLLINFMSEMNNIIENDINAQRINVVRERLYVTDKINNSPKNKKHYTPCKTTIEIGGIKLNYTYLDVPTRTYHRYLEGWMVRGHIRRYKDGKIVYVNPYIKGNKEFVQNKNYLVV